MWSDVMPRLLETTVEVETGLVRSLRSARALAREALCGLGGHEYLQHREGDRLCLRCQDCGHETPGWQLETRGAAPRRRFSGAARRAAQEHRP